MDYLDHKKELRHRAILMVGYVLIAIAVTMATIVLLYQAYGFGIGKNGTVIQNSLAFFSSQPNPAQIYVNNKLEPVTTNTSLVLPAGIYRIRLTRSGYRDWQRTIELQGGDVQHYDYPLMIPIKLDSNKVKTYTAAPGLMTQSPDRRWVMIEKPNTMISFDLYDLQNSPLKAPTDVTLPANLLAKATKSESWKLGEWADDNQHVLLQHNYDGKTEFILVDRKNPTQSVNLNTTLLANPTKLTLDNKKYNQYYLYDAASGTLQSASLQAPTPITVLQHVLAYQSYGSNTLLYATTNGAPPGKVLVKLKVGNQTYPIHAFPAGTTYLLNLTEYSGTLYVAAGASSQDKVYIYADPVGQLTAVPQHALAPAQVLHVDAPDYLSFSDNAQFITVEHGTQFGVYDIENSRGYSYVAAHPIDTPQAHATWMDGDRLTYVSSGKILIFDYDSTNQQTLVTASSSYVPAFSPSYKNVYELAPSTTAPGQFDLMQTFLLTPRDR